MDKYNINRNRGKLTPEDVEKGKNFDQFMKAYSARPKPFTGSGKFYLSIATVGVVAVVGTWAVLKNNDSVTNNSTNEKNRTQTNFVTAPFSNLNEKDTVWTVDAAKGNEFIYNTGSLVNVPANAFTDDKGNVVNGKVEIHYREFHDPSSIFFAGIPMTYDSAGARYHFESAGMLQITAWQNGKPLKVNPAANINVAMESDNDAGKFNVYYLDTAKKNWNFIAKDKAVEVGFVADTSSAGAIVIAKPVMPLQASGRPSFAIKFDQKDYPELLPFKGMRFEVDTAKTPYKRSDKNIDWEDVSIKRGASSSYLVTFTKGETTRSYETYVVVSEKDFAGAKEMYDKRYAQYEAALKVKQDRENKLQQQHENSLMTADARRIFVNDSVMACAMRMWRANVGDEKENMVMREFVIRDFGIWNSDCPASLPQGPAMIVKFTDEKTGKELTLNHIFLVEKGKNAIFTYYASDFVRFQFNPDAENLGWAVTSDGKLAVVKSDAFKNISGKKSGTLPMEVSDVSLVSGAQAKDFLGI
ncbi:MAG: hypothetical protein HY064_02425 [Bacteroidetes bacterium]|nr:hypothetical protein [Bacteroidota bacterium]